MKHFKLSKTTTEELDNLRLLKDRIDWLEKTKNTLRFDERKGEYKWIVTDYMGMTIGTGSTISASIRRAMVTTPHIPGTTVLDA